MSKGKGSNSRCTPDKRGRYSQPEEEDEETGNFSSGDGTNSSQSVSHSQHTTSVFTDVLLPCKIPYLYFIVLIRECVLGAVLLS